MAGRKKRALTHDDIMQAATRADPELLRRSELLWEDRSAPTRGPKRGVTPEAVVQAAIEIAQEHGLGAVTMQAVSAKVGFTTMAIYRYFPNKDALTDAIVDAGLGSPPLPTEPRRLAIVMTGNRNQEHWNDAGAKDKQPLDFFAIKKSRLFAPCDAQSSGRLHKGQQVWILLCAICRDRPKPRFLSL